MRPTLLLLFAVLFATDTAAQPTDSTCTYDTCALRYEPQFLGAGLVRGETGVSVGRRLSEAVAASPEALAFAQTFERTRTPAFLTTLASAILVAVAATPSDDSFFALSDVARLGLMAGGIGLGAYGLHLTYRSNRAQSRAVWYYNRSLPR